MAKKKPMSAKKSQEVVAGKERQLGKQHLLGRWLLRLVWPWPLRAVQKLGGGLKSLLGGVGRWLSGLDAFPSILLVMLVAAVIAGLAFMAVWWMAGNPNRGELGTDAQVADLVRVALLVAGGIGAAVALVVAYRRQKLGERNEQREDTKLYSERFQGASEQLGSENAMVRLAGVYAMAHLADDWADGRQTCIDVLCAYIRRPYTPPTDVILQRPGHQGKVEVNGVPIVDAKTMTEFRDERQIRQAILNQIANRLRKEPQEGETWHRHEYDFTGATIEGVFLHDAYLNGVTMHFRECRFANYNIVFSNAKLQATWLWFTGAVFDGVHIYLDGARVQSHLWFDETQMNDVTMDLDRAEIFIGTIDLSASKLTDTKFIFDHSDLKWGSTIDLTGMTPDGVDLSFVDAELKDRRGSQKVRRSLEFKQSYSRDELPEGLSIEPWNDDIRERWDEGYEEPS
ncbi:hypothetical protein [Glycomyces salinus]|uniref:hypothetical protein n=1 Tax=Glycomyces salinus TaxID=980294 RepID=UPI0018EAA923|nr:hypothetical protein [Glycomyces salinus]